MAATGGPSQIKGLTDLELDGLIRGADAARAAEALGDARNNASGPGAVARANAQQLEAATVTWAMLQQRHPEFDLAHWEECRALYAGGKRLLGNARLMARLFPQNAYEDPKIYKQRQERAHYFPYPGTIIDSLLAGLSSDPLRISFGKVDEKSGELEKAAGAEWWASFIEDVSDEAGDYAEHMEPDDDDDDNASGLPMHHFLVEVMREAEITRFTWVRCDLPPPPDDPTVIDSALAEEKAGMLSPYLCLVPAECVIDWEYDDRGEELRWLLTLEKTTPRASIRNARGKTEHHCYTLWTQSDWMRYEIDVEQGKAIADITPIKPSAGGLHPFGCVPFDRIMLPEGMWAMGKLHNLAREHFNKRCAMSWAEYKALFPILYEFLDTNASGGEIPTADDPNRATDQIRAQGHSQIRAGTDKAAFVGPDVAPFKEARESCSDTMREMHRVMYSMALSANMDKAALSRSGDSKQQDQISTQIVMMALGLLMRRMARVLLALVARGRADSVPPTIIAGLEHFDTTGVSQAIADAVCVFTGVPIGKSKTAYSLYLTNVLRKILGDSATDDQVSTIRDEITETLSAEELMQAAMIAGDGNSPPTEGDGKTGEDDDEDKNDGERDDEREPPDAPRVGTIRSKPMKR